MEIIRYLRLSLPEHNLIEWTQFKDGCRRSVDAAQAGGFPRLELMFIVRKIRQPLRFESFDRSADFSQGSSNVKSGNSNVQRLAISRSGAHRRK